MIVDKQLRTVAWPADRQTSKQIYIERVNLSIQNKEEIVSTIRPLVIMLASLKTLTNQERKISLVLTCLIYILCITYRVHANHCKNVTKTYNCDSFQLTEHISPRFSTKAPYLVLLH